MAIKESLLYTKSHEWVEVKGDLARIGITDHAIGEMGSLVFAEAAPVGRQISAGQSIGAAESVKIAADLFSPVSGEIVASWPAIGDELEKISTNPTDLWFVTIRMTDPGQLTDLMDAAAYDSFCQAGG